MSCVLIRSIAYKLNPDLDNRANCWEGLWAFHTNLTRKSGLASEVRLRSIQGLHLIDSESRRSDYLTQTCAEGQKNRDLPPARS